MERTAIRIQPKAGGYPPGRISVPITLSRSLHGDEVHRRATPNIQPAAIMIGAQISHKEKFSDLAMINDPTRPRALPPSRRAIANVSLLYGHRESPPSTTPLGAIVTCRSLHTASRMALVWPCPHRGVASASVEHDTLPAVWDAQLLCRGRRDCADQRLRGCDDGHQIVRCSTPEAVFGHIYRSAASPELSKWNRTCPAGGRSGSSGMEKPSM